MWQLSLLGETFREDGCSPFIADRVESECGLVWAAVGRGMERGEVRIIRRTCAVLLADRRDITPVEAYDLVDKCSIADLLDAVSEAPDDAPEDWRDGNPTEAAGPSTPG